MEGGASAAAGDGETFVCSAATVEAAGTSSNEVTVEFYIAYECRNNRNGTLTSREFAFGDNPGRGVAPPHMRQMTCTLAELYFRTGTGPDPDFMAEDPDAPVTSGMRLPAELSLVQRRPCAGDLVYMYFPAERGRTFTWRAGFYCASVL